MAQMPKRGVTISDNAYNHLLSRKQQEGYKTFADLVDQVIVESECANEQNRFKQIVLNRR